MRHYLFPQDGTFYKVNLHSHSVFSDGEQTPEDIKDIFVKKGYSAVAFTEHEILLDNSYLTDEKFVALTAYEYGWDNNINDLSEKMHINLFSKDPHDTRMVCFNPKYVWGNAKKHLNASKYVGTPDYIRSYTPEGINEVIRTAKDRDMLVVFNHPNWSMNTRDIYSKIDGFSGFEIINGDSNYDSDMDYVPHVYQELARLGKRMVCVGGDDNHCERACGQAWTMVKAESLTYQKLMEGIEKGNCYASDGPEIYELYIEDNIVTVHCSEASGIYLYTAGRRTDKKLMEKDGILITDATFRLNSKDVMFRISVKDANGHHANTRYYYFDELVDRKYTV